MNQHEAQATADVEACVNWLWTYRFGTGEKHAVLAQLDIDTKFAHAAFHELPRYLKTHLAFCYNRNCHNIYTDAFIPLSIERIAA